MSDREGTTLAELRSLRRGLRSTAEAAPPTLLSGVLARLGLADAYATVDSPLGRVFVAYSATGVSAVERAGDPSAFEARFQRRNGRPARPIPALPAALRAKIEGAIRGSGRTPPPFDLRGLSEFERAVLLKAMAIPRGEVRPYAWVAREIGRPGAVRAVGSALGRNPVPLLIPCHRVIRSDGTIGDYAMGRDAKCDVLRSEGVDPDALERLAVARERFWGSGTTRIYCYPSCRCARRIDRDHRAVFSSAEQAERAGYRPCQVCRPAPAGAVGA